MISPQVLNLGLEFMEWLNVVRYRSSRNTVFVCFTYEFDESIEYRGGVRLNIWKRKRNDRRLIFHMLVNDGLLVYKKSEHNRFFSTYFDIRLTERGENCLGLLMKL